MALNVNHFAGCQVSLRFIGGLNIAGTQVESLKQARYRVTIGHCVPVNAVAFFHGHASSSIASAKIECRPSLRRISD